MIFSDEISLSKRTDNHKRQVCMFFKVIDLQEVGHSCLTCNKPFF